MSDQRQRIGRWGEEHAARYLQERGYVILERNLRTPHGEIDILSRKDDLLVFVEVKTRSSTTFSYPEQAVTPRKQMHMLAAAEAYFEGHPDSSDTWQFDVIAIERKPGEEPEIVHFENVIG